MKDKPKQEPVQTAAIFGQRRLKCLPLHDGSEKDPIVVYKLYTQKRPEKMLEDDSSF